MLVGNNVLIKLRGYHSLSWETRVKVAVGAARGLSFFHDYAIMVTHEGVKSSSILLDEEFNANLSIFYPTTTVPSGLTHISTKNEYAAPEYIAPGHVTMKSDVYSFGIILLELLTGFRVCDKNRPIKEQNLVVWAKPYLRNKRRLLEMMIQNIWIKQGRAIGILDFSP
ncbi:Protein kinase superfamily protein [Perilla frutescens var. frutescens]|nr:Protein kinase superfamily protein [Perilla frutescens var. frutescens]